MSLTKNEHISIEKINKSKIDQVDFDNLTFGKNFTDYMFECDYKDGKWQNPTIKPYGNLTLSPATKVFHYGQAVFEGMKAYKDDNGEVFLFRPEENFKRINTSSKRMAIPEFPREYFFEALHTLLQLDKDWVQPGELSLIHILTLPTNREV